MNVPVFSLWRLWQRAWSAFLLLFILWAAGYACFAHYTASLAPPPDDVRTDAIVVLTGGAGRIDAGLSLLEAGAAKKLFVSGVGPKVTPAALLAQQGEHHTTPCCLYLGSEARNTEGNALETRSWAASQHVQSLRLVTAAYHMPRAWLQFHYAMPHIEILLSPAPLVPGSFEARHIRALTLIEYNKLLFSWIALYLLPPDVLHA